MTNDRQNALAPRAAATDEDDPIKQFKKVLQSCRKTSKIYKPPRSFIIPDTLLDWFRSVPIRRPATAAGEPSPGSESAIAQTNALRVLKSVFGPDEPVGFINEDFLDTIHGEDCWIKVFTILIEVGKGKYIEHFWNRTLRDKKLPIAKGALVQEIRGMAPADIKHDRDKTEAWANDFASRFYEYQFQLCSDDSLDATNGRALDYDYVLPIWTIDPIKPKSTKIYQVEIPRSCLHQNILSRIRGSPRKKDGHVCPQPSPWPRQES